MSLRSLAEANGESLGSVAAALGVRSAFLERVNAGRQALPRLTAARIAVLLGVSATDVIAEVRKVTNQSPVASPALLNPLPPIVGDPIGGPVIVPTQPVLDFEPSPQPPNPEPLLYFGHEDGITVVGSVTRTVTGVPLTASGNDRGDGAAAGIAVDNGVLTGRAGEFVIIGEGTVEQNWFRFFDPAALAEREPGGRTRTDTAEAANNPGAVAFDNAGKLWVGFVNSGGVRRYDPSAPDAGFEVEVAGQNSIRVNGGMFYDSSVDRVYAIDDAGFDGIHEIDPSSAAIVRTTGNPPGDVASMEPIRDLDGSNFTHIIAGPSSGADLDFVRVSDFTVFTVSISGFPDANTDDLFGFAWDPTRKLLWAANHFENRLLIIPFDPDTETVDTANIRTLATPGGNRPRGNLIYEPLRENAVALGQSTGDRIWFVEDTFPDDTIHIIDPATETVEQSITMEPITPNSQGQNQARNIVYVQSPPTAVSSIAASFHDVTRVGTLAAYYEAGADGVGQDQSAGRITRLLDRSGNGRHLDLTQGPGATLVAVDSTFNGLPSWDFDRADQNIYDSSVAGFTFDDLVRENPAPLPQVGDYVTVILVYTLKSDSQGSLANPIGDNAEAIICALGGSDDGSGVFQYDLGGTNVIAPYLGSGTGDADVLTHASNGTFDIPRGMYWRKRNSNATGTPLTSGNTALLDGSSEGSYGTAASGIIPQKANTLEVGGHAGSGPHPDMRLRKIIVYSDFLSRQSLITFQSKHIEAEGYTLV